MPLLPNILARREPVSSFVELSTRERLGSSFARPENGGVPPQAHLLEGRMDSHISEFSYGYTLTSELMALFALKEVGAPEFPTQNAEGNVGGGWDMKLPGLPIYLQFKRAARMVRRTALGALAFK